MLEATGCFSTRPRFRRRRLAAMMRADGHICLIKYSERNTFRTLEKAAI